MIEFMCPGCTRQLEANRAFAGFETRCLRCGTVVRIPSKSGDSAPVLQKAGLPKPRRAPAASPVASSATPPSPEPDFETATVGTATLEAQPPRRRSLKTTIVVPEATIEARGEERPAPAVRSSRKRKQKVIGGSIGGLVTVAILIAISFLGKSPKKTQTVKNDPPAAPKREDPKPPVVEKKPEEPKRVATVVREQAPAPRAVRPPVEQELTAAALLLEYGEGPPACDLKYDGKDLLVRGIFHGYSLGKVTIVPNDERSTPLIFSLLPPADVRSGELLTNPGLTPGQPVVLRGTYRAGCRFTDATIELTDSPADRAYVGKSICLEGAVVRTINQPSGPVPFPSIVLEPHATDTKLTVTCYFKVSDLDELMRLKPGQKIDIRGRCSGRTYSSVRLDNCSIVTPQNTPGPEATRLAADVFFTEYEADLLPFDRINPKDPSLDLLPVTAEGLGHAYQVDPRAANLTYRNRPMQISGYVKEKHEKTRMVVLQCGTDSNYSVAAVFSPADYANLPEERNLVLRGVCSGVSGGYIRIESAENADANSSSVLRTEIDFLPYRLGKEYIVDQIVPGRQKDSPIKRMAIRFGGDDMIQVVLLKQGTFPGWSLQADPMPEPKWSMYTPKQAAQLRRYRITDGVVEIGQPFFAGDKKEIQEFWEPVLKSGLKKGQSWSARFPDGKLATYTVMGFTKAEGKPDQLEIKRTLRDPKDPTRWEETGSTYARGIGEIRRIVSSRTDRSEAVVMSESRLVTDGTPPPAPELKADPKK